MLETVRLLKEYFRLKRLKAKQTKRGFNAGSIGRLTNDWTTSITSADQDLNSSLRVMRARSRDLAINNDYARRFLKLANTNIIGSTGILFQAKSKNAQGQLDKFDNGVLEKAWKDWSKDCSTSGNLSWCDAQKLVVESIARDGEILIRKVRGYDNPHKFALQFIEADFLDDSYSDKLSNGHNVVMGVEKNQWNRPVAYHILKQHPGDNWNPRPQDRERILAQDILHLFIQERPNQTRGFPWMSSSMNGLKMLNGYREAELVAARVGSAKMGFFTSPDSDMFTGEDVEDTHNPIMEAEPGTFEQLPEGVQLQTFDPQHPSTAFASFEKAMLRGIASGLNVSYTSLANDLESVNYSSARVGLLEEREHWKCLQNYIIEHLCVPVFEAWLELFLLQPSNPLPPRKYDKFNNVVWRPKGFQWVDPQKEAKANIMAVESGFKSRTDVVSETGKDFESIVEQLKLEKELLEAHGVQLGAILEQEQEEHETN